FLTVFLATLVPALIFYLYCLMNYSSEGFLRQEPWLILKVPLASAVPAVLHASLLVGFSAWSRTPLFAGVAYAGLYFCSDIAARILWRVLYHGRLHEGLLVQKLSLSGIINALQQAVLGVTVHSTMFDRATGELRQVTLAPPHTGLMLAIAAAMTV